MQALITLLMPFVSIVAQRGGPENLPKSQFLLTLVITTHIVVSYLVLFAFDSEFSRVAALPLLDTVAQSAFFAALLLGMGLGTRLTQTLTAAFGADVLLNLVLLPLSVFPTSDTPELTFPAIAIIFLLLWSLGIKGHILHRAIGVPYFVGVIISAGFFVAFYWLDMALFGAAT